MGETLQIILVLAILVGAVYCFATEKYPVDFVAMMVLAILVLTGLVSLEEGVSGFSNTATLTVGAMFVLSAGLTRTGALHSVARLLGQVGHKPYLLLMMLILLAALPSAFMNNTPVVAVFLPLVLAMCARRKISPSKLLIPLSFASQFGGVCTLIGTSTNILVSSLSERAGFGGFEMFEFTKMGVIFLIAGILYFLVAGFWMLPDHPSAPLTETYQLGQYITELRVTAKSKYIGKTILETELGKQSDVTVLEILRGPQTLWNPQHEPIREGDILLMRGRMQDLMELKTTAGLELEPAFKLADAELQTQDLALVETIVAPRAQIIGRTLVELDFRRFYSAIVLAIQRRGQTFASKLKTLRLRVGDVLLLQIPTKDIPRFRADDNFVVLQEVDEPSMRQAKAPTALTIVGLVVLFASLPLFKGEPLPILTVAIAGCIALVLSRCITLDEAYTAIEWRVIFLLAGVLPLGIAMEKSGTAALIAKSALSLVGDLGPVAVLAMLYLITMVLTEFLSNNAAAVLMTPIALSTAHTLGLNPKPLLFAIMFAASLAFATPVGYQTNTMVYSPGGYRFIDFVKVGLPLNIIFATLAIYFIPKFWPF